MDLFEIEHYSPASRNAIDRLIANNVFRTYKSRFVDKATFDKFSELRIKNPDFNFYFFDDSEMNFYMSQNWSGRKIFDIYKNIEFGASKADIFRYCVLLQFGGVYLDFDSNLFFSLEMISPDASEVISFESNMLSSMISPAYTPDSNFFTLNYNTVTGRLPLLSNIALQWLLIFRANHPILKDTIELIERNSSFFENKPFKSVLHAVCNCTGPAIYTRAIWNYVLKGNCFTHAGIDFGGTAAFKDIPPSSVYFSDENYYAKKTNRIILKK